MLTLVKELIMNYFEITSVHVYVPSTILRVNMFFVSFYIEYKVEIRVIMDRDSLPWSCGHTALKKANIKMITLCKWGVLTKIS